MIKCSVTACGKINRSAQLKTSHDGEEFISFGIVIPIADRKGKTKQFEFSVSVNGEKKDISKYSVGKRASINGTLNIVKRNDRLFLNLRADDVTIVKASEPDAINGSLEFKGKIGKNGVQENTDKNGNPYKTFSAFSIDKNGEDAEFTWVQFLYFRPKEGEDFLQKDTYIEAVGDLQLGLYKDNLSIECRLTNVSPWELKKQYNLSINNSVSVGCTTYRHTLI